MKAQTALFVILALLVVSCTAQKAEPQLPQDHEPQAPLPDVQVPTVLEPSKAPNTTEYGENETAGLALDTVACDGTELTFRVLNSDTKKWRVEDVVPFGEKDVVPVRILINNYQANSKERYVKDGVTYFGPNWPFSKNCGGVTELDIGEDMTCTLSPVPIKTSTAVAAGKNEIFIDTPTSRKILQFTCK